MAQRRLIILLGLVLAALALIALSLPSGTRAGGDAKGTTRVVIGGHEFNLEIADDDASRQQGLMNRTSIDEHGGMLFVFPDTKVFKQSFWMKNCVVDIDIIYLDARGAVTAMHHMKAEPPRRADESDAAYDQRMQQHLYPSGYPAQFAIELKSGWLEQLNLKVEDRIALDVERVKAAAR